MDKRGKNVGNYWAYKGKKVVQQKTDANAATKEEPEGTDTKPSIVAASGILQEKENCLIPCQDHWDNKTW